ERVNRRVAQDKISLSAINFSSIGQASIGIIFYRFEPFRPLQFHSVDKNLIALDANFFAWQGNNTLRDWGALLIIEVINFPALRCANPSGYFLQKYAISILIRRALQCWRH